jgi:para-aminobenzoate synthetase component I
MNKPALLQRTFRNFTVTAPENFHNQMLNWLQPFSIFCLLDSRHYRQAHSSYSCIAAAGSLQIFEAAEGDGFNTLRRAAACGDWVFGHIGYDCKNEIEQLQSVHPDHIGFSGLCFFQPSVVLQLGANEVSIGVCDGSHETIFSSILACSALIETKNTPPVYTSARFSKNDYVDTVNRLKHHMLRGDCYEVNFCQEFFAQPAVIHPLQVYDALARVSPNPFCGFYKLNQRWLLCASPERFLKKQGRRLISQPIKGTVKRQPGLPETDEALKQLLRMSKKEISENVMVADLVRNDLSKICEEGSVSAEELFGVYTFPQVHHLISTITGTVKAGVGVEEMMKAVFPMGSMTGAPKKKVMQLIEQYERTKRGIFSGALGYIDPLQNFDFNVVIRSIMYNEADAYVSYQVGSGITYYCDAQQEYEECLLKAKAMEAVLRQMVNDER